MMKVKLREIQFSQLNNKSLTLVSRYVRLLKEKEDIDLKLHDKEILVNISKSARSTENPDLKLLYQNLKKEIKISFFKSLKS